MPDPAALFLALGFLCCVLAVLAVGAGIDELLQRRRRGNDQQ